MASNDTNTVALKTQYNNAPDSVCPAGWRLPTGLDSANTAASREWNTLLVAEGIMTDPTDYGYAEGGLDNIRISPLWLARFDYVNLAHYSLTAPTVTIGLARSTIVNLRTRYASVLSTSTQPSHMARTEDVRSVAS
ncbi:hypothetical protein IIY66_03185 [Candidatus Saccharibacteria bacterium]|nr:hypothetical protein [Candidatus Saccharibacteria bacterium]